MRALRAADPERIRSYQAAWEAAHPERNRENVAAWRAKDPEHARAYYRSWVEANPERRHRTLRAAGRRRREAPFTWERMDPWPDGCQSPLRAVSPCDGPMEEGHEPPVAWMLKHPDHEGPLALRPECRRHNGAKRARPDWELAA